MKLSTCYPTTWFRGCKEEGNFRHMLWDWPIVKPFGQGYTECFTQWLEFCKNLLEAMLCQNPLESSNLINALQYILTEPMRVIARNWKSPTLPFAVVRQRVSQVICMEKLTAVQTNFLTKFSLGTRYHTVPPLKFFLGFPDCLRWPWDLCWIS